MAERTIRALVLSGGGAKGAYEAGVVHALAREGETFDIVVGSSAGALNATLVAQDATERLVATWRGLAALGLLTRAPLLAGLARLPEHLLDFVFRGPASALVRWLGVFDESGIVALVRRSANVEAYVRSIVVTSTDITHVRPYAFYRFAGPDAAAGEAAFVASTRARSGDLRAVPLRAANAVDAIASSAAIPVIFPPIAFDAGDGRALFVDGGVANATPIGLAIAAGADEVTVVIVDPPDANAAKPIRSILDVALASVDVMQRKILEDDFKLARMTNAALHAADTGLRPTTAAALAGKRLVALRVIRPATPLAVGPLDLENQRLIDDAIDRGLADGALPPPFER